MTRIAFYAPMKPPDHPTPSGDRRMARLFIEALSRAGYRPETASTLRLRDGVGDTAVQTALTARANDEIERIARAWDATGAPALWFTYHCYYKAPDLLGPVLADRFGIPYIIAEASRAKKRLTGPWAGFAARAEAAIDRADLLLAMTAHDRQALDRDATPGQRIAIFPPFLDPGPAPADKSADPRLRLLTVAMMRGADKLASYRMLADILSGCEGRAWHLTIVGDGPHRAETEALFAPFSDTVSFVGTLEDAAMLRAHYERADALVWPGVNEAYGMVYLEAQAAGTPVIAGDWPGPRSVVAPASFLVPPDDIDGFRSVLLNLTPDPERTRAVRRHIIDHHTIDMAARQLGALLGEVA